MLQRLKQIVARLIGRRPPSGGPTHDPDAGVREPRKRAPGGRHSSVALVEPEPDRLVSAVARFRRER
jgi:hypothetical protein